MNSTFYKVACTIVSNLVASRLSPWRIKMTYDEWLKLGLFASDYIPLRMENVAHPFELWKLTNQKYPYASVDRRPCHREAGISYYVWVSDVPLPATDFIGFPVGEFPVKQRSKAMLAAKSLRIAALHLARGKINDELDTLYQALDIMPPR